MAAEPIKKPEYIDFLLSQVVQDQLGFHVNVGLPDSEKERIGCLRWMLIARSKVLRTMLLESKLKVGDQMDITDMKPNTFKDFLTYVYGHDHTSQLKFGDNVDLLAAAEKYDVAELKSRLGGLLTAQVTTDNVCSVLENGPVCETVPELWEKTTKIIQRKTDVVFSQPQFLALSPPAVVHILQQDALNVAEIDVWRASLNWAWSQLISVAVGPPSAEVVRNTMDPLLRHTRLCAMPQLDIANEVAPSCVLSDREMVEVLLSIAKHVESNELGDVCSNLKKRNLSSMLKSFQIPGELGTSMKSSYYDILTKETNVELISGVIKANLHSFRLPIPKGLTYMCEGQITIYKAIYSSGVSLYDVVDEIPFSETVEYDSEVELKLKTTSGSNMIMEANKKYKISVEFNSTKHRMYGCKTKPTECSSGDFDVAVYKFGTVNDQPLYGHHFSRLNYRVC